MSEFRVLAALTVAGVAVAAGPIWAQAQSTREYAKPSAADEVTTLIEPEATQALEKMSAYLNTQKEFQVVAENALDLVLVNDQKIEIGGQSTYKVRRPNGFVIENVMDTKSRTFVYDGKDLTVYAPARGFYATAPAKATIHDTLEYARDNYGITVPLEDLFYWGDPSVPRRPFDAAFHVGVAKIDGVDADHYAYRQGDVDWQIWLQTGDRPLPLKVVIVDRSDPTQPEFTARLRWNLNPGFTDRTFAFAAPAGATPIRFASL